MNENRNCQIAIHVQYQVGARAPVPHSWGRKINQWRLIGGGRSGDKAQALERQEALPVPVTLLCLTLPCGPLVLQLA